jgi:hypothetical protein
MRSPRTESKPEQECNVRRLLSVLGRNNAGFMLVENVKSLCAKYAHCNTQALDEILKVLHFRFEIKDSVRQEALDILSVIGGKRIIQNNDTAIRDKNVDLEKELIFKIPMIRRMKMQGLYLKEIAKHFNVSVSFMWRFCTRHNIK